MISSIRIYNGLGTSKESLYHTFNSFIHYASTKYHISYISAEEIIRGDWIDNTSLLIIPGGKDRCYEKRLNGKGNKHIQNYLMQGGSFLGICAGAYYSGTYLEFAKSSPIEVVSTRELAIYQGGVIGPALCKYYYNSNKGARAARIILNTPNLPEDSMVFYNGGGYFLDAQNVANTKIIANYEDCKAAIIMCKFGSGRAILSGVHFEYDPYLMRYSKLLNPIIGSLIKHNKSRIMLVKHILNILFIKTE
ncbi:MAG: BPL-N domain-containing protein [Rickettsia endosymbiont of Labidopullus appendiculatus]|nr:BPL-N domain-containing protein [Rickettsia endosymbiont of Labidopullus appendiculatus]